MGAAAIRSHGARVSIVRGLSTIAEQASATSIVATVPGSLVDGDILMLVLGCNTGTGVTYPSGWLQFVALDSGASESVYGAYHVVTSAAGEPANYTFSTVPLNRITAIMAGYRGVDNIHPLDVAASSTSSAGTTLVLPSVTTVTAGTELISGSIIDAATAATLVAPGTMSELLQSTGTGRRTSMADEAVAGTGATGTRTWTQTGTILRMAGFLTALRPNVGGGTGVPRILLGGL
jgi:hypothetical protein